jgi:hypothetical protein
MFLFTITFRPALGLTQPPIQWVPGALSTTVKQMGLEADHSPQSSVEVKKDGVYYRSIRLCCFTAEFGTGLLRIRNELLGSITANSFLVNCSG